MKRFTILFIILTALLVGCENRGEIYYENDSYEEELSASYIVLSRGTADSGDHYELVGNQTESSQGYEIAVGVIKNNEWLCPLSNSFPFLGEDGLFHIGGNWESGDDLSSPDIIRSNIQFVDAGAFLMDCRKTEGLDTKHTIIIFSCSALECCTIDCEEFSLVTRKTDSLGYQSGKRLHSDNGRLLMYSEVSGVNSGWLEDLAFDWYTIDVQSLEIQKIAERFAGVCPESILAEGLIFASDQCFYDTNMQKVIDLSSYDIDMFYDSKIYFKDGTCSFKCKNELGTNYLVTIDRTGKVLSEVKQ